MSVGQTDGLEPKINLTGTSQVRQPMACITPEEEIKELLTKRIGANGVRQVGLPCVAVCRFANFIRL